VQSTKSFHRPFDEFGALCGVADICGHERCLSRGRANCLDYLPTGVRVHVCNHHARSRFR
jgi:hypothetical protein